MAQQFQLPSGQILSFPDDASIEEVNEFINDNFDPNTSLSIKASPFEMDSIEEVESSSGADLFNPNAGDDPPVGPFQVKLSTALDPGFNSPPLIKPGEDLNDPVINRRVAEAYFNLIKKSRGGETALAYASYNAGPGAVDRAIAQAGSADPEVVIPLLPLETQNYVNKVNTALNRREVRSRLASGQIVPPTPPGVAVADTRDVEEGQRRHLKLETSPPPSGPTDDSFSPLLAGKKGLFSAGAMLAAAGQFAAEQTGNPEFAQELKDLYAQWQAEAAILGRQIPLDDWASVQDFGDFLQFAGQKVVELSPIILGLMGAAAGAVVASPALAPGVAATTAVLAGAIPLGIGEVQGAMNELGLDPDEELDVAAMFRAAGLPINADLGTASAAAVTAFLGTTIGAIEVVGGPERLLRGILKGMNKKGAQGLLRRMVRAGVISAGQEASEEAVQTALGLIPEAALAEETVFTTERLEQIKEGAIIGAIGGGFFGFGLGAFVHTGPDGTPTGETTKMEDSPIVGQRVRGEIPGRDPVEGTVIGQISVNGIVAHVLDNGNVIEAEFATVIEPEVEAQETAAEEVSEETGATQEEFPGKKTEEEKVEDKPVSVEEVEEAVERSELPVDITKDIEDEELRDIPESLEDLPSGAEVEVEGITGTPEADLSLKQQIEGFRSIAKRDRRNATRRGRRLQTDFDSGRLNSSNPRDVERGDERARGIEGLNNDAANADRTADRLEEVQRRREAEPVPPRDEIGAPPSGITGFGEVIDFPQRRGAERERLIPRTVPPRGEVLPFAPPSDKGKPTPTANLATDVFIDTSLIAIDLEGVVVEGSLDAEAAESRAFFNLRAVWNETNPTLGLEELLAFVGERIAARPDFLTNFAALDEVKNRLQALIEPLSAIVLRPQVNVANNPRIITAIVTRILERIAPGANIQISETLFREDANGRRPVAGIQWSNVIQVAISPELGDPFNTAFHEGFHFLERMGLYTPDEFSVLNRENDRLRQYVLDNVGELEPASQARLLSELEKPREVRAWASGIYNAARLANDIPFAITDIPAGLNPVSATILEKMFRFFRQLRSALAGQGFQTSEDIFERVGSGAIGARIFQPEYSSPMVQEVVAEASAALNMTDTQFKKFFRKSQAVDELGRPRPFYLGSASNNLTSVPEGTRDIDDDAGPGFYFVDQPSIASERVGTFEEWQTSQEDLLDLRTRLRTLRNERNQLRREGNEGLAQLFDLEIDVVQRDVDFAAGSTRHPPGAFAPTLYPAYLSIQNPLNAANLLSFDQIDKLKKWVDETPGIDAETATRARDVISGATTIQQIIDSGEVAASNLIGKLARDEGHDGIFLTGGAVQGNKPHSVLIAFDSDQVKSILDLDTKSRRGPPSTADAMIGLNRTIRRNRPTVFQSVGDITKVGSFIRSPLGKAAKFPAFTPVFRIAESMRQLRSWITAESGKRAASYGAIKDQRRLHFIHGAFEAARRQGLRLEPNTEGNLVVANQFGDTDLSREGDVITLKGADVEVYQDMQETGRFVLDQLKRSFVASVAAIEVPMGVPRIVLREDMSAEEIAGTVTVLESTARQFEEEAEAATDPDETRLLNAAADQLTTEAERIKGIGARVKEMEILAQTDYAPFVRFGDFGLVIESSVDEDGNPVPDDEQGELLHFEQFEGVKTKIGQRINQAKVEVRIKELLARYGADARVRTRDRQGRERESVFAVTFDTLQSRVGNAMLTFDTAVSMLSSSKRDSYDQIRQAVEQIIAERGFASHLSQARMIPGYSTDFKRSWANYIVGASGFAARQKYTGPLNEAVGAIVKDDPTLKNLRADAESYRDYVLNPNEEFSFLRSLTFTGFLGGNLSSALLQLTNLPIFTLPYLSQFTNTPRATFEVLKGSIDTADMIFKSGKKRVDFLRGRGPDLTNKFLLLDPTDPNVTANLTPDEISAVNTAWEEGTLQPLLQIQQVGLTPLQQSAFAFDAIGRGSPISAIKIKWQVVQSVLASAFGLMETAGRVAQFLAAYRMARDDPKVLERADKVFEKDARWQAELKDTEGNLEARRQAFARFGVEEIMALFDKTNRAQYQRGPGAIIFQFSTWISQIIELIIRSFGRGAAGKKAVGMMALWLIMFSGLNGLPGAEDAKDLFEEGYRKAYDEDLDLSTLLREYIFDWTGSAELGEALDRGALRQLGVAFGRRTGLGQLPGSNILRGILGDTQFGDMAGPSASLIVGNWNAYSMRRENGERFATASRDLPLVPQFLRNFMEGAFVWSTDGYRTRRGDVIIRPYGSEAEGPNDKRPVLSGPDLIMKAILGVNPAKVARARELQRAQQRAAGSVDTMASIFRGRFIRALEELQRANILGDPKETARAKKRFDDLKAELRKYNAGQPIDKRVIIQPNSIRKRVFFNRKRPDLRPIYRAPRKARRRIRELEKVFP